MNMVHKFNGDREIHDWISFAALPFPWQQLLGRGFSIKVNL